jgi:hypothetical protein
VAGQDQEGGRGQEPEAINEREAILPAEDRLEEDHGDGPAPEVLDRLGARGGAVDRVGLPQGAGDGFATAGIGVHDQDVNPHLHAPRHCMPLALPLLAHPASLPTAGAAPLGGGEIHPAGSTRARAAWGSASFRGCSR